MLARLKLKMEAWCPSRHPIWSRIRKEKMENMSKGSSASAPDRPWLNTSLSPDERAALLLAQMTLEEKVGMVHGKSNNAYSMAPIARLGIPALTMANGPAGINEG